MTKRTLTELQIGYLLSRPWMDADKFARVQQKIETGEWTVVQSPATVAPGNTSMILSRNSAN